MKNVSKIIKAIEIFFIFFIIISLSVIATLNLGIKIDDFELYNLKFEKLYIKLDKKLIVRAENIGIPKFKDNNNSKNSSDYLLNLSQNASLLNTFFQEITIQNIKYDDTSIKITYQNDIFFIDTPIFLADLQISEKLDNKTETIKVKNIFFKDFDIKLNGIISANLKDKKYAFVGNISSYELNGKIEFALVNKLIKYKIYDLNANSLKDFINALDNTIKLNSEVKKWIYGYVIAKKYNLKEITGKIDLVKKDFFLNDLKATASAKNLTVKLDKTLDPINIKSADIVLEKSNLYFNLNNPTYSNRSLNGSNLYIYNIFKHHNSSGVILNLKGNSIYDKSIGDILRFYKINIPIEQKTGDSNLNLNLDINFDTLEVKTNGKITTENTIINIANTPFYAKKAIINILDSNHLNISAKDFGTELFKSDINASFDLTKKIADINGFLKNFNIETKNQSILNLKNMDFNATLDFSEEYTILSFKELELFMKFDKNNNITSYKPINFIPSSQLLKTLKIKNASFLNINTIDFKNFYITANNVLFDYPLIKKDGSKYENDTFNISISDNNITVKSESKNLIFVSDKYNTDVELNDVDVLLEFNDQNVENTEKIRINGKNSNLIFADINRTLRLPKYKVLLAEDSLSFNSTNNDNRIVFSKNKDEIFFEALNIKGEYVNQFLNSKSFDGGSFKLKVIGNTDVFKGEMRFYDTYFKDYKIYQSLLSFLNSIPALLTFKTPDFNNKGFSAKSGKVIFERNKDIINFIAINIEGSSANILGKGFINLKTKDINIDLEIEILKDASKTIDKIPLLNQIILGKDKTLSTLIKVRGTLDNPEYSTQIIQDTLMAPFKIIRNILQVPFLIFD
ncbi:putative protein (DUF3971 domain) [Campylobacter pinnipediorum subsp. caledonicus]|uniref:YhdP family protein n=1 Tax=Campylobacter pinnipediorum TaxID=1965231 RepID=UPI000995D743|nr:AsmA-like C-terminal domain-containing protein [Campylobacter pinnipediorum]AQW86008.1 putative protein (DUF3971 domain) [Campylobacter pinnipediorum subsp. caledonicus]